MRDKRNYITFFNSILNSYTQVFFSNNRYFAVILLIVTFFDMVAGVSGLASVIISNAIAWLTGFNKEKIRQGYYGFNSLLVGLGLGLYNEATPELVIILLFSAILTFFLTVVFEGVIGKYQLPFLSIPFIISIWIVFLASRQYLSLQISARGIYQINEMYALGGAPMVRAYEWFNNAPLPHSLVVYFRSLGAILFQYHLFPGILIAIGLLIYSRIAFALSFLGFYSAYFFYQLVGADLNSLSYSYIGFNFILTAIAIGGFFIIPSVHSYLWVILLTPVISMLLTASSMFFLPLQLSIYSLPFNAIVLIFIYVMKFRERHFTRPEMVYYQQYSPEKNLYHQDNNRKRFGFFSPVRISLPFWGEWKISQGHNGEITHKESWRHAWDFEIFDEEGKSFHNSGKELDDYYCFNKPVVAPADGWIEHVANGIDDNAIGEVNLHHNWGNTVVIRHADHLFSAMSHLKKDSIQVTEGTFIKKGDIIGQCGNSGRSPVPHLHFQLQPTPQVGSKTLDFPLSYFIRHSRNTYTIETWERPVKGDIVSNIEKNELLREAFDFAPGQVLRFRMQDFRRKTEELLEWEVQADIYNNTYLYCAKGKSKAWFRNEGDLFYFTQFDGDKESTLYYFYLACYKVIFGFYRNLRVKDAFPVDALSGGFPKFIQDFIAPFRIFIRSEYELSYVNYSGHFAESNMELASEARLSPGFRTSKKIRFNITFKDDSIDKITILENNNPVADLIWIKES